MNQQIVQVAQQLADIPELSRGFDAIGFSQGGQFLRGYVERNNSPPVHNLITFGSQHMGVSDLPACNPWDILCQVARRAANRGVYSEWAQENLVQVCQKNSSYTMLSSIQSSSGSVFQRPATALAIHIIRELFT